MQIDVSTLGWTIAGIRGGGIASYYITRHFIHRPKLCIRVDQTVLLLPQDFDEHLEFRFAGAPVTNIVIFALTVENRGTADIIVPDAAPPRGPNATLQPFLHSDDLRVIAVRTLNNDLSRCYVTLSRASANHRLYINIHRIRTRTVARFQVVATFLDQPTPLQREVVKFFPGAIPNINVSTSGLIDRQWLTTT